MSKKPDLTTLLGIGVAAGAAHSIGKDMSGSAREAANQEMDSSIGRRIAGAIVACVVMLFVASADLANGEPMIESWKVYWIVVLIGTAVGFILPIATIGITVLTIILMVCC